MLLEHVHTMEELSDAEFGQFIRAYATYVETGINPDFSDRSLRMMWKTVKAFDVLNCKKISQQSEARREAGKRGMAKRWGMEKDSKAITSDNKNNKAIEAITSDNKNNLSVSVSVSESVSESSSSLDDSSCETTTTTTETLFRDFRKSIGKLGETSKAELAGYVDRIGEDLVREIIHKCADAGGHSWAYVRKALAEAETQGVRTVEEYRLTHPLGAGRNQRVDRAEPSGRDFLGNSDLTLSLNRLKKKKAKEDPDVPQP